MADELVNGTQGHENESVNVAGLKATIKDAGNLGIFNKGVCSTAAGTAAKTVTVGSSFALEEDALVLVRFANEVTSENSTLSVNNSTAKPIYYRGSALEPKVIKADSECIMRYDGTSWNVIGGMSDKEVEIGSDTPVEDVKLFVDEDEDPAGAINIYNKTQVDTLLDGKLSNPIELTSLSADYTFKDGDTLVVGTGLYKCNVATTTTPPFDFVFDENGSIVIDSINGCEAVVADSDTLNTGWEKVADVSDRHYTEMRVATKADKATTAAGYGIIDVYTKNQIDALTRHTRLMDFDLNVLKKAVADQNLEKYGLKVGDQKTINGRTYVIADLNTMKGTIAPARVTANHVGLIVIPSGVTQKWNASGHTDYTSTGSDNRGGGYLNSDLHYYLKNTLLPLVESDLGASSLIGHNKLLSSAVTQGDTSNVTGINRFGNATGCSSNYGWEENCKICALSEVQVYGSTVWSSSGYDTGEACRQLEVFKKYSHTEIFGGQYIWFRDVVYSNNAASADYFGLANNDSVSHARYVAALILFH